MNISQVSVRPIEMFTPTSNKQNAAEPELNFIGQKPKSSVSEEKVIEAIEEANNKINNSGTELKFSVHEKTKQIMIKIVDTGSKEVLKEIPSEKILDMVANFMEIAGILVDKEA